MSLGSDFANALAAKDFERVRELLAPQIDFRGMTPNRALDRLETDAFADRERVGYRLSGRNPDGDFVVEQQAYLAGSDGRITWMRVLCSGFRPRGG